MPSKTLIRILPLAQLAMAALLLFSARSPVPGYVPTPTLICQAINSPAMLIKYFCRRSLMGEIMPATMWGLETGTLYFLLGVPVVWYGVARTVARPKDFLFDIGRVSLPPWLRFVVLCGSGALFFEMGATYWAGRESHTQPYDVVAILYWIWASAVCAGGTVTLWRSWRPPVAHPME